MHLYDCGLESCADCLHGIARERWDDGGLSPDDAASVEEEIGSEVLIETKSSSNDYRMGHDLCEKLSVFFVDSMGATVALFGPKMEHYFLKYVCKSVDRSDEVIYFEAARRTAFR